MGHGRGDGRHVQFVMTPPRGIPWKSNSISMYFSLQRAERDLASAFPHHPVQEASGPCSSLSRPHTLLSQAKEMFTHKSRELSLLMVLALPKAVEMRGEGVRVAEDREGLQGQEGVRSQPSGQSF